MLSMASLSYCSQSHLSAVTCHKFQSFAVEPMAEDQSRHKPFDSTSIGPNTPGKNGAEAVARLVVHQAPQVQCSTRALTTRRRQNSNSTRPLWRTNYPKDLGQPRLPLPAATKHTPGRRRGEQLHRRDLKCKHVVFANVCVCVCKCLLTVCRPLAGVFANIGVCKQ